MDIVPADFHLLRAGAVRLRLAVGWCHDHVLLVPHPEDSPWDTAFFVLTEVQPRNLRESPLTIEIEE